MPANLKHMKKDILFKEALAVLRSVEIWSARMQRHQVIFHIDNQALVASLNKGGCTQRPAQAIVRRIYPLAAWSSFRFRAEWISSAENSRADALSRFRVRLPIDPIGPQLDGIHFDPDSTDGLDDVDNVTDVADPAPVDFDGMVSAFSIILHFIQIRIQRYRALYKRGGDRIKEKAPSDSATPMGVPQIEPILPPTAEEVLDYLAEKGDGVKAKTIATWMSSIKMALLDMGADVAMFESRAFRQFRDGVRRVKGDYFENRVTANVTTSIANQ
ncbi:hypothetical protein QFC21_006637 [Naganishia friedmannii]|uniref:Uncharacterized protein n=1 Tax=Naganishia friedmannii TaxID=89922 RepID=A0ACC2V1W6_9TREE|nr:hypothetical protein QFC21_006637 [Naganishia friedmannii]